MIETDQITDTAAFVKAHWATISVAGAWLAREIGNFNRWAVNIGRTIYEWGGIKNIARKLWNGEEKKS